MEIDEPTTKKIRECGAKEKLLSLILVIIASCLIFPINICEFFLYEKLIEMRGDYVLRGSPANSSPIDFASEKSFPLNFVH